jgi:MYXO-CTERM domain-containing protein
LSSDDIAAVPEPSTLVNGLLGMGLTGFGAWRRRRKR